MARPSGLEQRRREQAFVAVLAVTGNFVTASFHSGMSSARTLRLLDEDQQVRAVAASVLAERREAAA